MATIEKSNVTKQFVLAGKSIFTIELEKDYQLKNDLKPHYTFKINSKDDKVWFVSYLTGPENTRDYSYIGILNVDTGSVRTTAKSRLREDSLILKLLTRTLALIWGGDVSPMLEKGFGLHHEGRCGKCGRLLTTPASCEIGIGPECLGRMK